uniref:Uncharacterized protein n=1 Tax=Timema genevievae TaxID=629358 RepID=A0A7R9PPS0_TIMGE|nr:unnamed protein product [Timema genevievae]
MSRQQQEEKELIILYGYYQKLKYRSDVKHRKKRVWSRDLVVLKQNTITAKRCQKAALQPATCNAALRAVLDMGFNPCSEQAAVHQGRCVAMALFYKKVSKSGGHRDKAPRRAYISNPQIFIKRGLTSSPLNEYELMIAGHLVDPSDIPVSWSDIAGLDDVIQELRETVILPIQKRELFVDSQLAQPPKGKVVQSNIESHSGSVRPQFHMLKVRPHVPEPQGCFQCQFCNTMP